MTRFEEEARAQFDESGLALRATSSFAFGVGTTKLKQTEGEKPTRNILGGESK